MKDVRDFYILWKGHPRYKEDQVLVQDPLYVIIQKIEMCLFSNKGDYIGDVNFGCDLEFYLWQTTVSAEFIQNIIQEQFDTYITELATLTYTLNVSLMEGELQDILIVDITVQDFALKAVFS